MQKTWNIRLPALPANIDPVEAIIQNRLADTGIHVKDFLTPPVASEYQPAQLHSMPAATSLVAQAIKEKKNIGVLWDVDTDGCTAGAIVTRYLQQVGAQVFPIINSGKSHGLWQQKETLKAFDLVIACDSLSNEYSLYEEVSENGKRPLVLLDHHPTSGSAFATIVNSTVNYPNPQLSGAGVCYKFAQVMDETLGLDFADDYLDLCAVGLIADSMDMRVMENRSLCYRGFRNLRNPALKEILAGYAFNATAVSYSIAPLFNACQRQGENSIPMRLLLSEDKKEIKQLIKAAKAIKTEQDAEVGKELNEALFTIKAERLEQNPLIISFISKREHSGLIANKLAGLYNRPAIALIQDQQNGRYTGSGRSFGVKYLKSLLLKTGLCDAQGHQQAFGITIKEENLYDFTVAANKLLRNTPLELVEYADAVISSEQITLDLIQQVEAANQIVGEGFKPIKFIIKDLFVQGYHTMQSKHTKFSTAKIEFIKWNDTALYEALCREHEYCFVEVLGELQVNRFRGKATPQMILTDYKLNNELPFAL